MLKQAPVVFLVDVDNTLLDNDRFAADLDARLGQTFGTAEKDRYWALYAKLRDELGYVDYLGTLQAFRAGQDDNPDLLQMSAFILEYPFARRLYPRALKVLAYLGTLGLPVVLSDGDMVFQPRKIQHSGIWDAVAGRVLITVHKERRLAMVEKRFPASHYVMIEDKPLLLAAMKRVLGSRLTSVFVRQGHHAAESAHLAIDPAPDMTIAHVGDLCNFGLADFHAPGRSADAERRSPSMTTSPERL